MFLRVVDENKLSPFSLIMGPSQDSFASDTLSLAFPSLILSCHITPSAGAAFLLALLSHPSSGVSAIAIAAGGAHTCIITTGCGVKCWGYNGHGQLGIGTTSNAWSPVDVEGA